MSWDVSPLAFAGQNALCPGSPAFGRCDHLPRRAALGFPRLPVFGDTRDGRGQSVLRKRQRGFSEAQMIESLWMANIPYGRAKFARQGSITGLGHSNLFGWRQPWFQSAMLAGVFQQQTRDGILSDGEQGEQADHGAEDEGHGAETPDCFWALSHHFAGPGHLIPDEVKAAA